MKLVITRIITSIVIITVIVHAIMLYHLEFTYSPIILLSFIISNISINTNGSSIPFITCENSSICINGMFGISIITAHMNIIPAYSPWNTGASLKSFDIPVSNPRLSHT